jgi:hypothetical protein
LFITSALACLGEELHTNRFTLKGYVGLLTHNLPGYLISRAHIPEARSPIPCAQQLTEIICLLVPGEYPSANLPSGPPAHSRFVADACGWLTDSCLPLFHCPPTCECSSRGIARESCGGTSCQLLALSEELTSRRVACVRGPARALSTQCAHGANEPCRAAFLEVFSLLTFRPWSLMQ